MIENQSSFYITFFSNKIDFIYLYKTKMFDDAFIMDCKRSYKKNHFVNIYSREKKSIKKGRKQFAS